MNQKAFTLIELLVVIAIVGILSGLIVMTMSNTLAIATDTKKKAGIDSLLKAIMTAGITSGKYPVQASVCDVGSNCANLSTAISPYLTAIPTDPDGSYYQYYSYDGTSFTVFAYLSNGDIYARGLVQNCPTGYIDSGHGFCVMQYEARDVSGVATSTASGTPWINITQYSASAVDAIEVCAAACPGCHLITNAEWTILASDAKQQSSNWNGTVMARGYTANTGYSPADSWTNSAVAPYTGTGYEYNTAANTVSSSGSTTYRRTLNLANGNVIWDLSGNVWEWTNNTCTQGTGVGNWYNSGAWIEWTDSNLSDYERKTAGVSSFTSSNGVGRYYGCTANGNAFFRGGAWDIGSYAGAFALRLSTSPSHTDTNVGFRCAR